MTKAISNLRSTMIAATFLCVLAVVATARADELSGGGQRDTRPTIPLAFASYLDADLPEQDVYIERVPGSGEVFRVTRADLEPATELYSSAIPVVHDPLNPAAIGPYPKGDALGLTLGEWRAHRGSGNYTCSNGQASLNTSFSGLVPNGVYSLRHIVAALPDATSASGSLNLPLSPADGAAHAFVADERGYAAFEDTFSPCLQLSNTRIAALLALNYHSDGKTYRTRPGDYGRNAHMPLFLVLPQSEGS